MNAKTRKLPDLIHDIATAPFVLRVVHLVKAHHGLPNYSPRLKNTCIRQVVSDK